MNKKQIAVILGLVLVIVAGYLLSSSSSPLRQSAGAYYGEEVSTASVGMGAPGAAPAALTSRAAYNSDAKVAYDRAEGLANTARPMIVPMPPSSENNVPPSDADSRMLIKTGQLALVVKDMDGAFSAIGALARKKGGDILNSSSNNYNGASPTGFVVLQVPVKEFEPTMIELKKLGKVESESTQGEDVTAEYVDLDSQLRNLQATEAQFLEIMKRAVKVSDVLEVQNQLSNVRGQIQSIQGRMKYYSQKAALSTINVQLSLDPAERPIVEPQAPEWSPFATAKDAVRDLRNAVKSLVDGLITFGIFYIPFIAVIGVAVWLLVRKLWPIIRKI